MQCEEKPRLCLKKKKKEKLVLFNINRDSPYFFKPLCWQLKLLGGMRDFQHFPFCHCCLFLDSLEGS